MNELVKNPELLKESTRDFDFFNFNSYAKSLHEALKLSSSPTVITLIGKYGIGKSVLLNEVCKLSKKNNVGKVEPKWIIFECWQYPDKKDLWEALIIELVEAIGGKKAKEKMIGSFSNLATKSDLIIEYFSRLKDYVVPIIATAFVVWFFWSYADESIRGIFISIFTSLMLAMFTLLEVAMKPISKSRVSRLNDYKIELQNLLKDNDGTIYIVLEDVDRAGELGRRFFETVSHFVREQQFENKNIKIIVPVSDLVDEKQKNLRDSIDKASDNILYFEPDYSCESFIKEIFTQKFLDKDTLALIVNTIDSLIGTSISVRTMKHVLRNAIAKHERLNSSDFNSSLAICISVEFSKYMDQEHGSEKLYKNRSHYAHRHLYKWANSLNLLDKNNDNPDVKEIEFFDYFRISAEDFAEIRYEDMHTTQQRNRKQLYKRTYLLSEKYFEDL